MKHKRTKLIRLSLEDYEILEIMFSYAYSYSRNDETNWEDHINEIWSHIKNHPENWHNQKWLDKQFREIEVTKSALSEIACQKLGMSRLMNRIAKRLARDPNEPLSE